MSSVSLGRLEFEIATKLQGVEDSLKRVDRSMEDIDGKYEKLRRNLERPINASVNMQDNTLSARAGSVAPPAGASIPGTAGQNTGGTAMWNGQQYKIGQAFPMFPGGSQNNPMITGFAPGRMQVRFPGQTDTSWLPTPGMTMGGTAGAPPGSSAKTPLGSSASYYSSDRPGDRAAGREDLAIRSSRMAAFQPLSPDEGRRNLRSHNDELIRALKIEQLDDKIPAQMKASKEHEDRRALRVARRDELQMERDLRLIPLSDQELKSEQLDRMGGPTAGGGIAGGGGGGGGRARGNFFTRPLRGVRSVAGLAIVDAGVGILNAQLDANSQMQMAGMDQAAAARAQLEGVRSAAGSVPLAGGLAMGVANLLGRGAEAIRSNFGAGGQAFLRDLGKTIGGPLGDVFNLETLSSTETTEETLQEAQRTNAFNDAVKDNARYLRTQKAELAQLKNPRDTFGNRRIAIEERKQQSIDAAKDWAEFAHSMDPEGDRKSQIGDALKKRLDAADKMADLQGKETDRMEQLAVHSLDEEAQILKYRQAAKGHVADRAALEKQLNEDIRAHAGTSLEKAYTDRRDQQLDYFDTSLKFENDLMEHRSGSDVRAFEKQGKGQDYSAAIERAQQEMFQALSRMERLFGKDSVEYRTTNASMGAELGAMRAQQTMRFDSSIDSSWAAKYIADSQGTGDTLGATKTQLELERRRRLREEVPKMIDPDDPVGSEAMARSAINDEIDARLNAATVLRQRNVNNVVGALDARASGNRFRLHDRPMRGDLVEQYSNFARDYANVQGSPEEQLRIRGAMRDTESTQLRILQKQIIDPEGGHASHIEAGQATHRSEDNKYLRDSNETLKNIAGMLSQLLQGNVNGSAFEWRQ